MNSTVLRFAFRGMFVVSLSLALVGCDDTLSIPKSPDRPSVAASGTVTLDGNPVPLGSVTYINIETGKKSVGAIRDGAFEIDAKVGPKPGIYGIMIRGKDDPDGPDVWLWNPKSNSKVEGDSHKEVFALEKADLKEVPTAEK